MTVNVRNDLAEIPRLGLLVSQFWIERRLPPEGEQDVSLAIEELVANVITHGYPRGGEHEIFVQLSEQDGQVLVELEDDGVPFNPLQAPPPDINAPLENRPVGGLGIHLVRHVMDDLQYERSGGRNRLLLKKRVGGQQP